ncbi:hypothetical protein SAMN05216233_10432 [Desulfoluna spongiiphila]|uniref:Uncharacterized protein n=1 Tax=Desulfoluna spongiiphila TaxID=419481 RepID=A0A1G5D7B6_9BACT|nr:hypothetical protein SAMN05216233_10432 [Desulfoluna spongiiphila]
MMTALYPGTKIHVIGDTIRVVIITVIRGFYDNTICEPGVSVPQTTIPV